jgi:hypothetical protein
LDKETLDMTRKIGGREIDTAPSSKIDGTEIQPDFLPLCTIDRSRLQRLGPIIKKAWVAKISNNSLGQFSLKTRNFSGRELTQINTHLTSLFRSTASLDRNSPYRL